VSDGCRSERVTVDGKEHIVRVRGGRDWTEEDRAHFGEIASAALRSANADPRHRAINVLVDHVITENNCSCGRQISRLDRARAAHLVDALVADGLTIWIVEGGETSP
jgi:hypothetical protein